MITSVKTCAEIHSNFQWVLVFCWQMCQRMEFLLHCPSWQRYKLFPKNTANKTHSVTNKLLLLKKKDYYQVQHIPSREVPATITWTWFRHYKLISEFVNMYQLHDVKYWDSHSTHDFVMTWSIYNGIWRLVWNVTQETSYVWSSEQKWVISGFRRQM